MQEHEQEQEQRQRQHRRVVHHKWFVLFLLSLNSFPQYSSGAVISVGNFSRIEQLMGALVIIIFNVYSFLCRVLCSPAAPIRIATYRGQFAIDFSTRDCRSIFWMSRPCVAPCTWGTSRSPWKLEQTGQRLPYLYLSSGRCSFLSFYFAAAFMQDKPVV